jgi:hypothetical protein
MRLVVARTLPGHKETACGKWRAAGSGGSFASCGADKTRLSAELSAVRRLFNSPG